MKYNEVLYTERQSPLKQTRGKGNVPQTRIHEMVNCKLYPLTRKEEDYVETDKGDVPIRKEYFQLWYMQGTPYALYDNYAYVTL